MKRKRKWKLKSFLVLLLIVLLLYAANNMYGKLLLIAKYQATMSSNMTKLEHRINDLQNTTYEQEQILNKLEDKYTYNVKENVKVDNQTETKPELKQPGFDPMDVVMGIGSVLAGIGKFVLSPIR